MIPPLPGLKGASVMCARCSATLARLGSEEVATRAITGDRWALFDLDGTKFAERGVWLRCAEHGSRGTWTASAIAELAQDRWDQLTNTARRASDGWVAVPV